MMEGYLDAFIAFIRAERGLSGWWAWASTTSGYLVAKGKGAKERIVPVGTIAAEKVRSYLEEARQLILGKRESKALFVTPRGGGFTRQGFWKLLNRYALKAGIRKPLSPHKLRA